MKQLGAIVLQCCECEGCDTEECTGQIWPCTHTDQFSPGTEWLMWLRSLWLRRSHNQVFPITRTVWGLREEGSLSAHCLGPSTDQATNTVTGSGGFWLGLAACAGAEGGKRKPNTKHNSAPRKPWLSDNWFRLGLRVSLRFNGTELVVSLIRSSPECSL